MSSKINQIAINSYSVKLSEVILTQGYQDRATLGGQDILNICPISQINSLIFKSLFDVWHEETSKLESDYFDFDHQDVKEALAIFKNKLSFHIQVKKEHLTPLVNKAVVEFLELVFTPKEGVRTIFLNDLERAKNQLKFLKIHGNLKDLLSDVELNPDIVLSIVDQFEAYEDPKLIMEDVFEIFPAVIEDFILEEVDSTVQAVSSPASREEQIVESEGSLVQAKDEQVVLNDRFQNEDDDKSTLASQYQAQKTITSLHNGININQRFSFIRDLFEGSTDEYNNMMDVLDNSTTFEEAHAYIKEEAYFKYDWNSKESLVEEFYSILSKKF